MKTIQLTQGYQAIVDDEDYEYLNQWKWYTNIRNKYCYAVRSVHSKMIKYQRTTKMISMSRQITNCPKGMMVDHINHNTLDNRKCNLRICTSSQNCRNRFPRKDTSSKYKGVSWHKHNKSWVVTICIDRTNIQLGYRKNEEEAARLYNEKAKELFGEFACLNTV